MGKEELTTKENSISHLADSGRETANSSFPKKETVSPLDHLQKTLDPRKVSRLIYLIAILEQIHKQGKIKLKRFADRFEAKEFRGRNYLYSQIRFLVDKRILIKESYPSGDKRGYLISINESLEFEKLLKSLEDEINGN